MKAIKVVVVMNGGTIVQVLTEDTSLDVVFTEDMGSLEDGNEVQVKGGNLDVMAFIPMYFQKKPMKRLSKRSSRRLK